VVGRRRGQPIAILKRCPLSNGTVVDAFEQRRLLGGVLEMFALGFAASLRGLESFDGDRVFRLQGRDFDGAAVK
jgi:hypothetical protein